MSTYEPGTLAVATVRGVEGVRVFAMLAREEGTLWRHKEINGRWASHDSEVTDVRPLVVLDPEDFRQSADLRDAEEYLRGNGWPGTAAVLREITHQIEAQKPPRIPEPQHCGAMVIAAQKGEDAGSERGWVRFRHGKTECWIDALEHVRSWDDLENPVIQECEVSS